MIAEEESVIKAPIPIASIGVGVFTLTESPSLAPTFAFIALETKLQAFASKAREEQRGREAVCLVAQRASLGALKCVALCTLLNITPRTLSPYDMYVYIR